MRLATASHRHLTSGKSDARPPARIVLGCALALLSATALRAQPLELMVFDGPEIDAHLGMAVSGAGDVDGDGRADLVVGATDGSGAGDEPGRAMVFSGADGSLLHLFAGDQDGDAFGTAVDGAGDANGDGFDDVVVGARYSSHTEIFAGTVRVYSGLDGTLLHEIDGDGEGDRLGYSVAGAGDVDLDGFDDFVAGAAFDSETAFWAGSVQVFSGRTGAVLHHFDGDAAFDFLGTSVGGAGDVDGDGRPDIVAGAPDSDDGGPNVGLVRVYSGADGSVLHELHGNEASSFGQSVAGAGDVDGDGRGDFVAGAPFDDTNGGSAGLARVFSGRDGSVLATLLGGAEGDNLGYAVAGLGDLDGDGFDDVAAGALSALGPDGERRGAVRVVSGRDGSTLFVLRGDAQGDRFAAAVGAAGDVDADGHPELIVGASGDDEAGTDAGSARVYSGMVTLQAPQPGEVGVPNTFRLTRVTPDGPALVAVGGPGGTTVVAVPGCGALVLDLAEPLVKVGTALAGPGGEAELIRLLPEGAGGRTVAFQAVDPAACRVSNRVVTTLAGAGPGTR